MIPICRRAFFGQGVLEGSSRRIYFGPIWNLWDVRIKTWSKPIWLWINTYYNSIFRGMNIHKSQLFWCEQKGYLGFWHTPSTSKNGPQPLRWNICRAIGHWYNQTINILPLWSIAIHIDTIYTYIYNYIYIYIYRVPIDVCIFSCSCAPHRPGFSADL